MILNMKTYIVVSQEVLGLSSVRAFIIAHLLKATWKSCCRWKIKWEYDLVCACADDILQILPKYLLEFVRNGKAVGNMLVDLKTNSPKTKDIQNNAVSLSDCKISCQILLKSQPLCLLHKP